MAWPDDGQQGWIAVWLTGIVGALGIAWKSWFGVRKDARDDRKGEIVNGTYESVLRALRESHEASLREIREQLKEERELRRQSDERADRLQARLVELLKQQQR